MAATLFSGGLSGTKLNYEVGFRYFRLLDSSGKGEFRFPGEGAEFLALETNGLHGPCNSTWS